jgi:hypothetical protein
VDEGFCSLKCDHGVERPRDGRSFVLLATGIYSARRRIGMRGSLGEKIGEGAYSEAYAWAPGQVVKLFKPGLPRRMPWFEVHMIRAGDVRTGRRDRRGSCHVYS